jgi:hypothetical protein
MRLVVLKGNYVLSICLILTAAARVRSRVWSSGICGGQSGAGAGFFRVLRFPLPIFEPTIPATERTETVHALDRSATVTRESN